MMKNVRNRIPNIHPGEVLLEDFLKPMKITQYRLAKDTGIAHPTVTKIVQGKRTITADTALRFARFFGTTPGFWLNLQKSYDIEEAELKSGKKIEIEVKPLVSA